MIHQLLVSLLTIDLDEEIQSTCLRWLAEFLLFVQPTMLPFTPRLIPVILSSLAHHVIPIRTAANETNYNLYKVVQELSVPIPPPPPPMPPKRMDPPMTSPVLGSTGSRFESRAADPSTRERMSSSPNTTIPTSTSMSFPSLSNQSILKPPSSSPSISNLTNNFDTLQVEDDFDYGATVNALTLQFLNEHEETRVAALEWLLMLHQKAPKKVSCILFRP